MKQFRTKKLRLRKLRSKNLRSKKLFSAGALLVAVGLALAVIMLAGGNQDAVPEREDPPPQSAEVESRPEPSADAIYPLDMFDVRIERPRSARPFYGILPDHLEARFITSEQSFSQISRGAELNIVSPEHLEISAQGWHLILKVDGEGKVIAGSSLVSPFGAGDREVSFHCYPAEPPVGSLHTVQKADSRIRTGEFRIELVKCKNATSGRPVDWPPPLPFGFAPSPLVVIGSFATRR